VSVSEGRAGARSVDNVDDTDISSQVPTTAPGELNDPSAAAPAGGFVRSASGVLRWLNGRLPAYGPPVYHRHGYLQVLVFAVLMVGVGAYWSGDDYRLGVMTTCFIYAIAAVGLYFAYSLGGLFAFSQGAFMGLGAYVSAKVGAEQGFLAGLGSAAVVTFVVALVVGVMLRKARHLYFAVGALAVASLMGLVFSNWEPLAGPDSGAVYGIVPPSIGGREFVSGHEIFWFTLVIMVVVMVLGVLVERSPMRRNALAAKEIPAVAQASGVPIYKVTIMLFGFGSALAGIAGSVDAHSIGAITPDAFNTGLAINLYLMILLGGLRSIWGAVVGAIFFVWMPELLRPVQSYTTVIYSFLLLFTIILLPDGIVGTLSKLARKVVARVKSN
jgi:branched-chain amino acid transport system permease protein